jgi:methyl-accepting chemotaxis protein
VDALPLARSSETKDKIAFAALYRGEFKNARAQFYENLAFLIQFQKQASDAYLQTVQITSQKCVTAMTIFAVIGFFASLGVGMFSSKNLSTQLSSLANQLSNSAGQLSSSSSDLATASEQLLSSIDGQTSAIYETSTSMDEMNSMVNKSSENASHSQKVSVNSDDSARSSQKSMNEMLRAMDELDKSINTLTVQTESNIQSFSEINRVISEIGNKTKVINDIVFQTKLLSFNASVEAARAGEHGKGFSVVAEEVGNLAQHSGNAAQEIQNMINSSISNVSQIVSRSKSEIESIIRINREKVESGKTIATECGKSLEEVVTNVGRVRAMIDEISTAAKEQAIGIGEVTKTMAVLSQGTQQNAEVSKRASHASEQVAQQADDLRQMVTQLLHSIYGNKTATTQKQDQERPSGKTKGAGETSSKNPNMAA